MHRILLIEDSEEHQLVFKKTLVGPQINLIAAYSVREANLILSRASYDPIHLIILDLGLPDGNGLDLLESLQKTEPLRSIPVFLLTGEGDIQFKLKAFQMGAEDYLVKPVNPMELRARVEMRLRKTHLLRQESGIIRKANLLFRPSMMRASIKSDQGEDSVDLTSKEFKILLFLAQNEGQIYSRNQLVKSIWGESVHVLDRTVDSHICALRKKLNQFSHYVESIPGLGYRFNGSNEGIRRSF